MVANSRRQKEKSIYIQSKKMMLCEDRELCGSRPPGKTHRRTGAHGPSVRVNDCRRRGLSFKKLDQMLFNVLSKGFHHLFAHKAMVRRKQHIGKRDQRMICSQRLFVEYIQRGKARSAGSQRLYQDRKSTRLNSSHVKIS